MDSASDGCSTSADTVKRVHTCRHMYVQDKINQVGTYKIDH